MSCSSRKSWVARTAASHTSSKRRKSVARGVSIGCGMCGSAAVKKGANHAADLPPLSLAGVQHHAVARFAGTQVVNGVVDLAHGEVLDLRQDLMARAELQHFRHIGR